MDPQEKRTTPRNLLAPTAGAVASGEIGTEATISPPFAAERPPCSRTHDAGRLRQSVAEDRRIRDRARRTYGRTYSSYVELCRALNQLPRCRLAHRVSLHGDLLPLLCDTPKPRRPDHTSSNYFGCDGN